MSDVAPKHLDPEPLPEPTPEDPGTPKFWDLVKRQNLYKALIVLILTVGIYTGYITIESAQDLLDSVAKAGPGLATTIVAISGLIMALKNPTED